MPEETTTIAITLATRDRIKKLGVMGDDYDSVINKALDALEKKIVKSKDQKVTQ